MKAKLIKTEDSYILKDGDEILGIDHKGLKERLKCPYLLSTENCESIDLGIDLNELANELYPSEYPYEDGWDKNKQYSDEFKAGFKKALELTKDKKFTKIDLLKCIIISTAISDKKQTPGEIVSSLSKREWEVEIETEDREVLVNGYKNQPPNIIGFIADYEMRAFPKLDENECLILKMI